MQMLSIYILIILSIHYVNDLLKSLTDTVALVSISFEIALYISNER